jgi:hypothetical protein
MPLMSMILFKHLLDATYGEKFLHRLFKPYEKKRRELFQPWYNQTGEASEVYPSQGLLLTPFDYLDYVGKTLLPEAELWPTLRVRSYVLEVFNHPDRIKAIQAVDKTKFVPPPKVSSQVMEKALRDDFFLSVRDLGLVIIGSDGHRIARRQLLQNGPFIKLGKYARIPFSGGAMPDIFGAPAALATMAACHALACIPRNGAFSDMNRQADLAQAAWNWLEDEPILQDRTDKQVLLKLWRRNFVGVIEPDIKQGLKRAKKLYDVGVRTFRVYSPEPGRDAEDTVKELRHAFGEEIEIFAGQVTSVHQAQRLQKVGADGLYAGVGGGGRCTTAAKSDSAVDWPELVWQLRGEVDIPVLVEGGASDHIGVTLALGASGIGTTRMAGGGTIESPGSLLYLVNQKNQWFKPYGGEASARTKYQDGKMMPCNIPAFVEGETTMAFKSYIPHVRPTLAQNMLFSVEELILSLVFRGCHSIEEFQALDPNPLRRITFAGSFQQQTH